MRKLAHLEIPRLSPAELESADRHPVTVLLENIRSAHNVGSIFRTADALRLEQIIVCGFTPDPDHKGVRKSALGAGDYVPWIRAESSAATASRFSENGYTIAALEITDAPTPPGDVSPSDFPLLVVVGNEVDGVSDELIDLCDMAFELPQFGAKQSLNVSVAAGVALYDLVRSYRSL